MLGYVVCSREQRGNKAEEMVLAGVRFVKVSIGTGGMWEQRRADRAARLLARRGVRQAVFPEGFSHLPLFLRRGVRPVETLGLRRLLAGPWLVRRLDRLEIPGVRASAAVSAAFLDRQGEELVTLLTRRCRYVMVDGPGETLARRLRREWGVAILLHPGREELESADALALLSPRADLSGRNPAFCAVYPGAERGRLPLLLPEELRRDLEGGQGEEQMAAALYFAGVLTPDTILKEIGC